MSGKVFEYFCNLLKIGEGDNFDYYFSDVTRMFKFYGLDSWTNGWKVRNLVKCVIPVILMTFVICQPLNILVNGDNYYLLLQALLPAIATTTYCIKLLMAVRNRSKLANLVDQIRNEFWKIEDDDGDDRLPKKKLLQRKSRPIMLIVRFYAIQVAGTACVYCLLPVYNMVLHSKFDTPLKIPLPFFDNDTWKVYIANYCIHIVCLFFINPSAICMDILQPMFIIQCTTQLDILNTQLEKLSKTKDNTKPDVKKSLRQIHESHDKLRAFMNEIGGTFAVAHFFQLLLSAIMLAFTIYVTSASPLGRSIELYMLTLAFVSQLALLCFSGQYASDKFEEFDFNLQQVPWYEFSKEEQKDFLFIVHNTQQPVVIKSYIFELSVVMFSNILNNAYSYYAILQALES